MKKFLLCCLAIALAGTVAYAKGKSKSEAKPKVRKDNDKVVVYYFHTNFRCPTCKKIEQYSKEAVENNFKKEMKSGKLCFLVINYEEEENEHFVKDYELYTKSLVISLVKNGKETKFKNLTKVWELLGKKDKFAEYVKEEANKFLKEL